MNADHFATLTKHYPCSTCTISHPYKLLKDSLDGIIYDSHLPWQLQVDVPKVVQFYNGFITISQTKPIVTQQGTITIQIRKQAEVNQEGEIVHQRTFRVIKWEQKFCMGPKGILINEEPYIDASTLDRELAKLRSIDCPQLIKNQEFNKQSFLKCKNSPFDLNTSIQSFRFSKID